MKSIVVAKPALSLKKQSIATVLALASAVALPQIFHLIGIASGTGVQVGTVFSPMHLPIMLAGLLAGPFVGAVAGLLAPLLSFALTGMPLVHMVPLLMVEVATYGLCAGLLRGVKMPTVCKVLITMIAGRVAWMLASCVMVYILHKNGSPFGIWFSVAKCLPGILLQLVLLPLLVYRIEHKE